MKMVFPQGKHFCQTEKSVSWQTGRLDVTGLSSAFRWLDFTLKNKLRATIDGWVAEPRQKGYAVNS
jgi:hypothetical protein